MTVGAGRNGSTTREGTSGYATIPHRYNSFETDQLRRRGPQDTHQSLTGTIALNRINYAGGDLRIRNNPSQVYSSILIDANPSPCGANYFERSGFG